MAEPTYYLFDGYNLLHASSFDDRRELVDRLADYVAVRGARGVVVFDGVGDEASFGPIEVRFAPQADRVIERLAADNRGRELVCVVTSDIAVLGTAGQEVRRVSSKVFLRDLAVAERRDAVDDPGGSGSRVEDAIDDETRKQLELWRRQKH
jgi:predicted RNA-binding protein with PIN domain